MSEELRPCPFCEINDWQYHAHFSGATIRQCGGCGTIIDESIINTRPIEDELRKRIAELEEQVWSLNLENERLEEAYCIDETITPDGTLKPSVRKLLERLEKAETDLRLSDDLVKALDNRIAKLTECIGSQMADVYTLKARIAELEAMVEELKPYRDGYDGEFLEPTDDRFYLIRHTNGQLVTWRKVDNHDDINFLGWGAKGKPRRYWRLPEVQE
jgi:DNA repair exonuclease SbcCD ATPase subunit